MTIRTGSASPASPAGVKSQGVVFRGGRVIFCCC
jgi:hypothetical protein